MGTWTLVKPPRAETCRHRQEHPGVCLHSHDCACRASLIPGCDPTLDFELAIRRARMVFVSTDAARARRGAPPFAPIIDREAEFAVVVCVYCGAVHKHAARPGEIIRPGCRLAAGRRYELRRFVRV